MELLLFALILAATASLFAFPIRRGFKDGDRQDDVRVTVVSISRPLTGPGGWIELSVANPGTTPAFVGLRLRGGRLGQPRQRLPKRRPASSRRAVTLAYQIGGAVGAGETGSFWLWSERDPAGQAVRVLVVSLGRLRVQTLAAERAADLSRWTAEPLIRALHR